MEQDLNNSSNNSSTSNNTTNDLCKCGRKQYPPHCVKCGGAKIYTSVKKTVLRIINAKTGEMCSFKKMRCEKCGAFDEYQLLYECQAPIFKTTIEKHKEEYELLQDRILLGQGPLFTTYERNRFKLLSGGMTTNEFYNAVKIAKQTGTTLDQARELNKIKEHEIKEEKLKKENSKIRHFGRIRVEVKEDIQESNEIQNIKDDEPKESYTEYCRRIGRNTNESNTIHEANSSVNTDSNNTLPDDTINIPERIQRKPRSKELQEIKKDVIFEGGLSDEDLRNLPGIMEILE
jgi:hypothetical protein